MLDDVGIPVDAPHHVLVPALHHSDILAAGDDLHPWFAALVIAGDEGAGVVRFEGIFDAQGNPAFPHPLGRLGVDGLHAEVGELVGDVVIRVADGDDFLLAHGLGVGAA